MTEEQRKEVIQCLVDFVERVSKGGYTTTKETEALPAVANLLFSIPW